MKVKDVIARALGFIGRDGAALKLSRGEELDGEESETAETLLYCYNAVEDELARFYFSLVAEETLRSFRGVYEFSAFSHKPFKIISVQSGGKKISYTKSATNIQTGASEITVKYRYAPDKKELDGECEFAEDTVTEKMLAAGAASEYCLINGDMSGSQLFENMYRQEIDEARRSDLTAVDFPPRRWV